MDIKDDTIYCDDCLAIMREMSPGSVDLVLADLPYGQTREVWDQKIHLKSFWSEVKRITKESSALLFFSQGMFTAEVLMSNPQMWRYNLVWDKVLVSGQLNANKMPMRVHEDICVFWDRPPTYHPQKYRGSRNHATGKSSLISQGAYGCHGSVDNRDALGVWKHPTSILRFPKPHSSKSIQAGQKPISLFRYLIKTYTNEGDLVFDPCVGTGTTALACLATGRRYIGVDIRKEACDSADKRIAEARSQLALL